MSLLLRMEKDGLIVTIDPTTKRIVGEFKPANEDLAKQLAKLMQNPGEENDSEDTDVPTKE